MNFFEVLYLSVAALTIIVGVLLYVAFKLLVTDIRLDHWAFRFVYGGVVALSFGLILLVGNHLNWAMSLPLLVVFVWLYGIYLPGVQRYLADRGHPWGRVPETAGIAVLRDRAFNEMHLAASGEFQAEFEAYRDSRNRTFHRNAFSVIPGGGGGMFWVGFLWDGFEILEWYFHRGFQEIADLRLRQSYTRHSISLRVESLPFHKQVIVEEATEGKDGKPGTKEKTAIVTLTGEVVSSTSEERFDSVPIYDTGDPLRVSSSLEAQGRFSGPWEALFVAKNPHDIINGLILQEWRLVIASLSFLPPGYLDRSTEVIAKAFAERRSVILPKAGPLLNVALGVWQEVPEGTSGIVETITDVTDDGTEKIIHFAKRYDDATGYPAGDVTIAGMLYHKYGYFLLRVLVTDMEPADIALRTTFQKVVTAKFNAQAVIVTAEGTKRVTILTAEGARKAKEEEGEGQKAYLRLAGEGRAANIRNQIAALAGVKETDTLTELQAQRVVEVYLRHFYMEQMPAVTQTTSGKFVLPLPIMDALFGGRTPLTVDGIISRIREKPALRDELAKLLEPSPPSEPPVAGGGASAEPREGS